MSQSSRAQRDLNEADTAEISPWHTLLQLARPFRGHVLIIICLAALSTTASLIEPLIYRVAINDVAGLFVGKAQEEPEPVEDDTSLDQGIESADFHLRETNYQTSEPQPTPHRRPSP